MGAVLAMKKAFLLCALIACGPVNDPAALRAQLTPERVAPLQAPMIFAVLPETGVAAALVPAGQNGAVLSWQTRDEVQLSFADGVLVASRGLGHDLMSAEVDGTIAALRGGPDRYARRLGHLDGHWDVVPTRQSCEMTRQGDQVHRSTSGPLAVRVFAETCDGATPIENRYHKGADGRLWWSRQWVSPEVGYVEIELIRP